MDLDADSVHLMMVVFVVLLEYWELELVDTLVRDC